MRVRLPRRAPALLAAILALSAFAFAPQRPAAQGAWSPRIEYADFPARQDSFLPQLSVHGDRALLSWIELVDSQTTLWFSERTSTGWSPPRRVASGEDWFVTESDVPMVVRIGDTLAASWPRSAAGDTDVEAYDLQLAFSNDDGRTWSRPTTPHHDGTKSQHGFPSLFPAPGGGLGVVWLDGRAITARPSGPPTGAMTLRGAAFDRTGKQLSETPIAPRVCECCPTASAITSEGPIVAFRNRSAAEVRDIYVSRLAAGRWTAPQLVHNDGWKIAGCPVNGAALAAGGREVAIAWFTAPADQGHSFLAFSADAGRTFGAPVRLDDASSLGRVDVELLADRSAVGLWMEVGRGGSELRIRRVTPTGQKSPSQEIVGAKGSRPFGYPRMARRADELLFAWTEAQGGAKRVRTAVASLK